MNIPKARKIIMWILIAPALGAVSAFVCLLMMMVFHGMFLDMEWWQPLILAMTIGALFVAPKGTQGDKP